MFTVYILRSKKNGRHYIGHTGNLSERIKKHNNGQVPSTKLYCPWGIIYTEEYGTKSMAAQRELEIKKYKGGILFKKLLGLWKE